MQDSTGPVRTQPIGGSNRGLSALVLLIVGLIALAAFKPWETPLARSLDADAGAPVVGAAGMQANATASPSLTSPSPDPSLELLVGRKQCQNPDDWRIVTMERTGPLNTRTLLPATPVVADGPSDPAIVALPFHATELFAIGYCTPVTDGRDVLATEARITVWQRLPDGRQTVLRHLRVLDPALATTGEVYLGPAAASNTTTWRDAIYIFEAPGALPSGAAGWFSLDFSASGPVALNP